MESSGRKNHHHALGVVIEKHLFVWVIRRFCITISSNYIIRPCTIRQMSSYLLEFRCSFLRFLLSLSIFEKTLCEDPSTPTQTQRDWEVLEDVLDAFPHKDGMSAFGGGPVSVSRLLSFLFLSRKSIPSLKIRFRGRVPCGICRSAEIFLT